MGLSFLIGSCGNQATDPATPASAATACSAAYNGTWIGPSGAKLILNRNCTLSFIGSPECKSDGTYTPLLGSLGAITVEIATRTGSLQCPPVSRFQCSFILSGGLTLDCGAGSVAYSLVP